MEQQTEERSQQQQQQQASQIEIVEELLSSTQLAPMMGLQNYAHVDEEEDILFAVDSESDDHDEGGAPSDRPLNEQGPTGPPGAVPDSPPHHDGHNTLQDQHFDSEIWLD